MLQECWTWFHLHPTLLVPGPFLLVLRAVDVHGSMDSHECLLATCMRACKSSRESDQAPKRNTQNRKFSFGCQVGFLEQGTRASTVFSAIRQFVGEHGACGFAYVWFKLGSRLTWGKVEKSSLPPQVIMPEGKKVQHDTEEGSEFLRDAVQQASTAMGKLENEKDISRHIKAFFDGKYGPNWHCIVGKGFATHATYEAKTSMFFVLPPLAILLYKMGITMDHIGSQWITFAHGPWQYVIPRSVSHGPGDHH
eukprot:s1657_g4.t1